MAGSRYQVKIDKLAPVMKNKAVRTYSSLGFSIVAIAIFSVFAIKPTVENIFAIQKQVDQQTEILRTLKDKSAKLAQAINNYNAIPQDTKLKLFTLLPNTPNPTCFIDSLSSQAGSAQVDTVGFQLQPFDLKGQSKCTYEASDLPQIEKNNSATSSLKDVPFTMNASKEYPQLSNFISSLKQSVRLISVESASFSKNTEGPLLLSVTGKVYYYK